MKKLKYKTPYDYELDPARSEIITGESMTEPDQAMSLKELIERHIRGELGDVDSRGTYDVEPTLDDEVPIINDLTDVDAYVESVREKKLYKLSKAKNHEDEGALHKESDEDDDFKRMKKNKASSDEHEDQK